MRGYRTEPNMFDRIISAASYLTMGFVGFIWMIICYIAGKPPMSFVKYHIIQSIFISIVIYLIKIVSSILLGFIGIIPFVGALVNNIVYYFAFYPTMLLGLSIIQLALLMLIIYLAVTSFMGKYTIVPWISDNVRRLV
ncbi:MAG: hypothetical protein PHC34_12125 [Candidatus Gastranaerophilales bacterium]|nr:hypothetical protein [Candidatus Gastranaerophilales bacterium]